MIEDINYSVEIYHCLSFLLTKRCRARWEREPCGKSRKSWSCQLPAQSLRQFRMVDAIHIALIL